MNFFKGHLECNDQKTSFVEQNDNTPFTIELNNPIAQRLLSYQGKTLVMGVRPEDIDCILSKTELSEHCLAGQVELVESMGSETYIYLTTGNHSFTARLDKQTSFSINESARLKLNLENVHFFDPESQEVIT